MSEFEGNLNPDYYKPRFKESPKPNTVVKPSVTPLPQMNGYAETTQTNFWGGFFVGLVALTAIVLGIFMVYYVSQGMFKSDINQAVDFEPVVNSNTENNYSFNPETNNEFKNTLNATIIIQNLHVHTNSST